MKTIGNIIWFVVSGFWMALGWALCGALCAITIIGIPFAIQCFKLAQFCLWPFGRTIVHDPSASALGVLGNILWFLPGLVLAIGHAVLGVLLCLTILGIPFGIQNFKMVPLALFPFGKTIVTDAELGAGLAASRSA